MRNLFNIILFLAGSAFWGTHAFAQTNNTEAVTFAEKMPEYPGGSEAMMKFFGNETKYPKECKEKKIEGRVILQFVVNADGQIDQVKVIREVHPLLAAEAVRVVKAMPKWSPGTQNDKAVNVVFTLPFVFKLN
jgi:protein TonB